VTSRTLDNGITVLVRPDAAAPLAVVDLWVYAGSVDDGGTGAAHALEHMVFRGSKDVPAGRVDATVEAAGGVLYATTYPDATHYWAAVPPEGVPTTLGALADAMCPPAVATADWERERKVMLEEISRDRDNLPAQARRTLAGRLFGTAYGAPVMGTPAALNRLEPDGIRAFHRQYYRPDRMGLVVVGRVEPDRVVEQARAAFGTIPKPAGRASERAAPKADSDPVEVEADDGTNLVVGTAWPAPSDDAGVVDVLCAIMRRRVSAAVGGLARRVEVSHPWQRADMIVLLLEGAESDRDVLRAAARRALSAPAESITASEVAAAARQRQWAWWAEEEKPAAQSRALGLAAAIGSWRDATAVQPRLDRVSVEGVRSAARKVFGTLEARRP
jgi:zinc protease